MLKTLKDCYGFSPLSDECNAEIYAHGQVLEWVLRKDEGRK
ncbi:MAG: hypothetical protein UY48_C0013G0035 [Candidatus Gottesmanbacteria bacterium GW2011_GWB1_49_7]|uniref:Uncharacterized protein n=1 Tax=Candidatus Gottesmanbacteria bacterium GW2011_GWB1_49_7 TaxID=1618448 RepID=A0A0G1YZE7_9BACT|nr:MAG: hypothetical protein UY48_C0013G0035 [Candidatus Gottesmanbacteria bacterium GW2011_GWB1_49_7]